MSARETSRKRDLILAAAVTVVGLAVIALLYLPGDGGERTDLSTAHRTDDDQDGVPIGLDLCPNAHGPTNLRGCPGSRSSDFDWDRDGWPDRNDRCPRLNAESASEGSLDGCPAVIQPEHLDALRRAESQVVFESGAREPPPAGKEALQHAAEMLNQLPSRDRIGVLIVGHTDNDPVGGGNDKLSLERAEACKAQLVSFQVSPDRIKTAGDGSRSPLQKHDTPGAKAKNRRVDFNLVDLALWTD